MKRTNYVFDIGRGIIFTALTVVMVTNPDAGRGWLAVSAWVAGAFCGLALGYREHHNPS